MTFENGIFLFNLLNEFKTALTFEKLHQCKPGDTVVVGSGEYHEDVCIGIDGVSLVAASEISGYSGLNEDLQVFANACRRLPAGKNSQT